MLSGDLLFGVYLKQIPKKMGSPVSFLQTFVLPLVSGGEVHVGNPLVPSFLEKLYEELIGSPSLVGEIDLARGKSIEDLFVSRQVLEFDLPCLRTAASLYNLLLLAHPQIKEGSTAYDRILGYAKELAIDTPADTTAEAVNRHALLCNVFKIRRADVRLSWWTGKASYQGQKPPSRLTRFRGLRRVHEETEWQGFESLFSNPDAQNVLFRILRGSPLTQLLFAHAASPILHWENAVFLLRDAEICRGVCYSVFKNRDPNETRTALSRYTIGLRQMLNRSPDPVDVRAVVGLLVYLNVLLSIDGPFALELTGGSLRMKHESTSSSNADAPPEEKLDPERLLANGFRGWAALPTAAMRVDPAFAEPSGLLAYQSDVWHRHRDSIAADVGEKQIGEWQDALKKFVQPKLTAANAHSE